MTRTDLYPTRGTAHGVVERQDPVVHGPSVRSCLGRFERDGYLFRPELCAGSEVAALHEEALRLRDRARRERPREAFFESGSDEVRSVFAVHRASEPFAAICEDARVLDLVGDILGDDVYLHQTRLNYKPAFKGNAFYWHSDFETWHAEDGMPRMRAVSLSLSLTPSLPTNGPLMVLPGSHRHFVACPGVTPSDHYRESLIRQRVGTPDEAALTALARGGIAAPVGAEGSAVLFDCNLMHGSSGNITPFPRINLFAVYNAVSNRLEEPFCGSKPRPEFVGARDHTPALPRRAGA